MGRCTDNPEYDEKPSNIQNTWKQKITDVENKESVKRWAEEVIESYEKTDEYKREKDKRDKEFQDFILYGKPTKDLRNEKK